MTLEGYDPSDGSGVSAGWQRVTNTSWPPLGIARTLRDFPSEHQVDVVARIVFEDDGEQFLPGRATRWTRSHVCVLIVDPRLQVAYNWLAASDVRRHQPEGEAV